MKKETKNYTVTWYDKGLHERFYFAGFAIYTIDKETRKPKKTVTGCPVIVKKFTKEKANEVKAKCKKLCGGGFQVIEIKNKKVNK